MLRSLYSAVSGVKGHQTYLDVTGNNIANVNTVGFKRDSVLFADQIYQTQKSASAPNNGIPIGGINPAQVGLGVQVAAIETIHSQGSSQNTGQETDMMINGKGFFVTEMGGQRYYTRSGAFSLDRDYNLVQQGTGYLVQGYEYKNQIDPATGRLVRVKDTELSSIRIPIGEKIPAKATELVNFRCNLCQTASAEIEDVESIPGGTETVPRPHDYLAYGSPRTGVTFDDAFDPANAPAGVNGQAVFKPVAPNGELYIYSSTYGWQLQNTTNPGIVSPTNIYTGADPQGGDIATIFNTGDGQYTGAVLKRATVDYAGNAADRDDLLNKDAQGRTTTPVKAGATYLASDTGTIYTANSTGTEWLPASATDVMNLGYAYAAKDGSGIFTLDKALNDGGQVLDTLPANPADGKIYIYDTDKENIFYWDESINGYPQWTNLNQTLGLYPNGPSDRGDDSTTTQATIDAFGESIIRNNDHTIKLTVYDSLGAPRTMEIFFRKVMSKPSYPNGEPGLGDGTPGSGPETPTAAETQWDWYACFMNSDGSVAEQFGEGAGTLVFGDDGLLKRTYYFDPTPASPDPAATPTSQPVYNWTIKEFVVGKDEGQPTGVMIADFGIAGAEGSVVNGVPVTYESNKITLDFLGYDYSQMIGTSFDATGIDGVTDFASPTTTVARYQDGYAMGVLNNFSVGSDGTITGQYSNGQNLPIAQVAVAMFANDAGLTKVGGTYFQESANSGMAQIGGGMSNGAGSIMSNNLEMSNVDLSEEFVNLIRAQRGLQANSRVVTTSDQVLEELINLKR